MNIPLLNLKRQYKNIEEEVNASVLECFKNAQYIMGENVKQFEKEIAEKIGVKHAITVGNGTDALIIALKSLGIKEGDEVITTDYTFFATAEAIRFVGATPVFCDVELDTYNIDPSQIEEKITDKTKAIICVHLFGNACKMDQINDIAKRHNLYVIEDAAQAINSQYKGKNVGNLADLACFSFFPTKNLGCFGDGGMITTNDDDLATIIRALKVHGSGENGMKAYAILNDEEVEVVEQNSGDNTVYNPLKYYNYLIGHNSRLDEIQAAILRIKLKHLDEYTENRRSISHKYIDALKNTSLVMPTETEGGKHVFHLFILQSENREEIESKLKEKGIATGTYYKVPMHLQKAFNDLGYKKGDFPNAEYLSERTFAIPLFPEMNDEEREYIINSIKEIV
ncbi:MAG: DegT/DnrJ/EryC1/StrS family aminotransferase [Finegoldia magna]|uniref:DegT/DnrJ/EryC1/StrS aminotransferase family protein n=1 Tax=Finegoldia magna BVS033A4 TaxID=866773 RepID=E1KWE1_FINMA|nr:DegT/DnrJ/EryC1/StrS family aminotransferase [Finegoldia magna]EFK93707.1 DegT/DnrJ/EryC1/StrS aminotransferase family protein [Finegoldia magna ACS-171-V-Col3]EFL54573.1 DegT/DnrJ/EryC1/StrS aminotransferase family protein [Finegoldia magna BVS033A4]KXA08772.1 pleiotropic regulatory protein DegT domain protein [Finegoldia magna]MBS6928230.1 DegT/DnrJ/EryC1/StrS family aminotransferase [Finegoldia magna]MDU5442990.1 DegT/DnrJ/EryC1/StrS family aminotransferase [Finegoldia magna]